MNRTERRREFGTLQQQALLRAIRPESQQQLRERACTLALHGNSDQQIAVELSLPSDLVRRWIAEGTK